MGICWISLCNSPENSHHVACMLSDKSVNVYMMLKPNLLAALSGTNSSWCFKYLLKKMTNWYCTQSLHGIKDTPCVPILTGTATCSCLKKRFRVEMKKFEASRGVALLVIENERTVFLFKIPNFTSFDLKTCTKFGNVCKFSCNCWNPLEKPLWIVHVNWNVLKVLHQHSKPETNLNFSKLCYSRPNSF